LAANLLSKNVAGSLSIAASLIAVAFWTNRFSSHSKPTRESDIANSIRSPIATGRAKLFAAGGDFGEMCVAGP